MSLPKDPKDRPPGAKDEWYREMLKRLEWYFRRNTRYAEAAPDLAQEALLAALNSTDIEKLDNPAAYLMRTAVNLASRRRLQELWEMQNLQSLSDDLPLSTDGHPKSAEPLILTPALESAFSRLDTVSHDVLWGWLIGCTYEEIGDRTSLEIYEVHRKLRGALELLRSRLNFPTERK